MSRSKRLLIVLFLLLLGGYFAYDYVYADHRDIENEAPTLVTNSADLLSLFKEITTPKVLNKTVSVRGTITQIEAETITLDEVVHCSFGSTVSSFTLGDVLTVKGRCIGYDELFEIVKLDQCSTTN